MRLIGVRACAAQEVFAMKRLEEVLAAARCHAFYREEYARASRGFADVPVLEKETLYARLDAVLSDDDFRRGIYWS